jgi:peptide-methionine (R)-S-oxide reductase
MPKVQRTPEQWREQLTPIQFHVTRESGTERPFTGEYWNTFVPGEYRCVCCDTPLFTAEMKFDSHCGWPSFDRELDTAGIERITDRTHGMLRVEIRCGTCDAHLGHVFTDGPTETGERYCVNSASIVLEPR